MCDANSSVKPDFFIVGAPKSGTTALYEYLKSHPDVCLSHGKEPHFFCDDFPGYQWCRNERNYLQQEFSHCRDHHKRVGEASVWYLYSSVAAANIREFNPAARIIVILRNPVDMLYSLHSQMLYNMDEDQSDFETAWRLQSERRQGRNLPPRCREPRFLQYAEVGRFGAQLQRLFNTFERQRIHVVFLDELRAEPVRVYRALLDFLGLDYDGRTEFPIVNNNRVFRSQSLQVLLQTEALPGMNLVRRLYRLLGINRIGLMRLLNRLGRRFNSAEQERPPLCAAFRQELVAEFSEDIRLTEALLGVDLQHWMEPTGTGTD